MSYSVRATWTNPSTSGLDYNTVTPCRLVDTRLSTALASQITTTFPVTGTCGIPSSAKALMLNVTAISSTANGNISLWPADLGKPATSVLNFVADGGTVQLVLDVVGYFQ